MSYSSNNISYIGNSRRYDIEDDRRECSSNGTSRNYHHYTKSGRKSRSPDSNSKRHSYVSGSNDAQVQSLKSQLAAVQSQVLHLETELNVTRSAKSQAENRAFTLQRDNNALQTRNSEVISVMKTLEAGVEALQKEKTLLSAERDDLKAKIDASEKNSAMLNEQVSYLNERNSTLSKKCVDLLDGSRDFREKAIVYEEELKRIKPRYEEMDAKFGELVEQNKSLSMRLHTYEMREKIWIREKSDLEQRQNETIDKWQKSIAELRAHHEAERERIVRAEREHLRIGEANSFANGPKKADFDRLQRHIENLQLLVGSMQTQHKVVLSRHRHRIQQLEERIYDPRVRETEERNKDANLDEDVIVAISSESPPSTSNVGTVREEVKGNPAG